MAVLKQISSRDSLRNRLSNLPQVTLCNLPTPLHEMLKLSEDLGGVRLFIKRDDLTGLAFGGNKARKLDFILADVRAQKADTLVTWAGLQSNWCRQAIAACRVAGIRPVVILFKRPGLPSEHDGNLLLDEILGAEIKLINLGQGKSFMALEDVREVVESVADRERRAGIVDGQCS